MRYHVDGRKPGPWRILIMVPGAFKRTGKKVFVSGYNDQPFLPPHKNTSFWIGRLAVSSCFVFSSLNWIYSTYVPTSITEWCLCCYKASFLLRSLNQTCLVSLASPSLCLLPLWCVSSWHCLIWPSSSKETLRSAWQARQGRRRFEGQEVGRWRGICCLKTWANSEVHLLMCSWLLEYQDREEQNLSPVSLPGLPTWHLDQLETAKDWFFPRCVMEHLLRKIKKQKSSVPQFLGTKSNSENNSFRPFSKLFWGHLGRCPRMRCTSWASTQHSWMLCFNYSAHLVLV